MDNRQRNTIHIIYATYSEVRESLNYLLYDFDLHREMEEYLNEHYEIYDTRIKLFAEVESPDESTIRLKYPAESPIPYALSVDYIKEFLDEYDLSFLLDEYLEQHDMYMYGHYKRLERKLGRDPYEWLDKGMKTELIRRHLRDKWEWHVKEEIPKHIREWGEGYLVSKYSESFITEIKDRHYKVTEK